MCALHISRTASALPSRACSVALFTVDRLLHTFMAACAGCAAGRNARAAAAKRRREAPSEARAESAEAADEARGGIATQPAGAAARPAALPDGGVGMEAVYTWQVVLRAVVRRAQQGGPA